MASFVFAVNYYAKFFPHLSVIIRPLNDLKKKGTKLIWIIEHEESFEKTKRLVAPAPILALPDWSREFKLYTDASFFVVGAVLYQIEQGINKPIVYMSKKFDSTQLRYK